MDQGTVGDYHLMTNWGYVMLRDLPAWRRAIFEAAKRRKDGWFDMRTRTGKAAARQFMVVNRWTRRNFFKAGKGLGTSAFDPLIGGGSPAT